MFQFHKGSIKTPFRLCAYQKVYGFNSTKVRLRRVLSFIKSLLPSFQFHKGSIKTLLCYGFLSAIFVSIPQRFD